MGQFDACVNMTSCTSVGDLSWVELIEYAQNGNLQAYFTVQVLLSCKRQYYNIKV